MADVFISYAREDRDAAARIATLIADRGWSVWWDRSILPGKSYSAVIQRELDQARCVVVVWSQSSIESDWVQNEAAEGFGRKVLIPVLLESVKPPLEFRRLHAASLFEKDPLASPDWEAFVAALVGLLGTPARALAPLPETDAETDSIQYGPASSSSMVFHRPPAGSGEHLTQAEVDALVDSGSYLDADLLRSMLDDPDVQRIEREIAAQHQVRKATDEEWVKRLRVLRLAGIERVGALEYALQKYGDVAVRWARDGFSATLGPVEEGMSMTFVAYVVLASKRDVDALREIVRLYGVPAGQEEASVESFLQDYERFRR